MSKEDLSAKNGTSMALAVWTELYWLLPTLRFFLDTVALTLTKSRILVIRLPSVEIPGLHRALEGALDRVHVETAARHWLKIDDGMDIATQIGAALERKAVSAEELAVIDSSPIQRIVIEARSAGAAGNCDAYLKKVAQFIPHNAPEVDRPRVLALLPEAVELSTAANSSTTEVIRFSGALTPDEMAAYVGARMADRRGPGSTGLLRHLVAEFAAFDVWLAEQLLTFTDEALLSLPQSLDALSAEDEFRWRSGAWSALCYADIAGRRIRHTLYEIQLSRLSHLDPEQGDAQGALKRKYWRACVRSLLPYLEENRALVLAPLRGALERHTKATGGRLVRPTFSPGRSETKCIDDAEYNDICGLIRHENLQIPEHQKAIQAVEICKAAKQLRDDLAHLRAPQPSQILRVTRLLENFGDGL